MVAFLSGTINMVPLRGMMVNVVGILESLTPSLERDGKVQSGGGR
jgi:hypothetical protein